MKRDARTMKNAPDAQPKPPDSQAEAALAAVRTATRTIHGIDACSHPVFDALTAAGQELVLGLAFHAIDDTEQAELDTLTTQAEEVKAKRDGLASQVGELQRRLGIANEDIRSLERMRDVLEAIARHESVLERARAAVENQAEYRRFLDSFGDRVLATQAEWCRCLNDVDAAVAAARGVLKREYEEAQRQWTAIEQKVLRP